MGVVMIRSISSIIIAILLAIPGTVVLSQTKPNKQEMKAAQVKEKITKLGAGKQSVVKVTLYTGTTYQGTVGAVNESDFTVVDKAGNSNTVRYLDVQKIGGKNLSSGAKIGIGIGIGAGAALLVLWLILENYG